MTAILAPHPVLADLVPRSAVRNAALVAAGTAAVAVASQITIPLWFTPVPLSLATFAVVLTGAALGPNRAAAALLLWLGLGIVGAPVFAGQGSGWAAASFGYAVGYLPAAILAGAGARRRADRSVLATAALAAASILVVYAAGVPWLMAKLDLGLAEGLRKGLWPFVAGDLLKAGAAALLLPATWKLIDRTS